jgi:putative N6-adenine-specific DNA methylase
VILTNPPYGERIEVAGVAGAGGRGTPRVHTVRSDHSPRRPRDEFDRPIESPQISAGTRAARETAIVNQEEGATDEDFFPQLATHWKTHFDGWTAHLLVPDMKLPGKMRLKESRRVPLWNGPIECRLFRFDIQGRRTAQADAASEAKQP